MPNVSTNTLIQFSRYPIPGETKTRLIPALGAEGAARLQRRMTEYVFDRVSASQDWRTVICGTGASQVDFANWLGPCEYRPQASGDLGHRMESAFENAFADGASSVVIIGSDCPDLNVQAITAAYKSLEDHDLVFGPAEDGGYYLIGCRADAIERAAGLFRDMPWGGPDVLQTTVARASEQRLMVGMLDTARDIDTEEDIPVWEDICRRDPVAGAHESITVVIPAINEEASIDASLLSVASGENIHVVVVDGGSDDQTPGIARDSGATVIDSPPGRATQMNAGAAGIRDGILLFLHADSSLPLGYDTHIRRQMLETPGALGAFEFSRKLVPQPISKA